MRPTVALTLALSTVGLQGCFLTMCRGYDSEREDTLTWTLATTGEGEVILGYEEDTDVAETDDTDVSETDDTGDLPITAPLNDEADCTALCEQLAAEDYEDVRAIHDCRFEAVDGTDDVKIDCDVTVWRECPGGRHHADLHARAHGTGPTPIAAFFAREAHGEAGSVLAFRRLARELRRHGAPADLIARAQVAAADEVRHARAVGKLARAHQGNIPKVDARPASDRTLFDLALENAVEGCVHETYAAAQAMHQAATAPDAAVRAVAAAIAPDEARHAELAHDLHAWVMSVLPADQGAQVEQARRDGWAQLAKRPPVHEAGILAPLGLPDRRAAREIVRVLRATLAA